MNSYGNLSTMFYDLDKPYPPPEALAYYALQAQLAGGLILEPMCGSGRFLIPLMQQGFEIVGVDASVAMLTACRLRAQALGLNPKLILQSLHHMSLPGMFSFAMIPEGSICLLTEPSEARQALRQIFHALQPGAAFCVEIDQWLGARKNPIEAGERSVQCADGARINVRSSGAWDPSGEVVYGINRYDLIRNNQVTETEWEQINLMYYHPDQFADLLAQVGFGKIQYHSAFDMNKPIEHSESLVFSCYRP